MQKREPGSNLVGDIRSEQQVEQSAQDTRDRLRVLTHQQIEELIWEQLRDASGIDCTTWQGRQEFKEVLAWAKQRKGFWSRFFSETVKWLAGLVASALVAGSVAWWSASKK